MNEQRDWRWGQPEPGSICLGKDDNYSVLNVFNVSNHSMLSITPYCYVRSTERLITLSKVTQLARFKVQTRALGSRALNPSGLLR